MALGPSWMPAPTSVNSGACSNRRTSQPARRAASAAARPRDAAAGDQQLAACGFAAHVPHAASSWRSTNGRMPPCR